MSLANNIITVYQAVFIALGTILSSFLAREMSKKMVNAGVKLTALLGGIIGILTALLHKLSCAFWRAWGCSDFRSRVPPFGWWDNYFAGFNDQFWSHYQSKWGQPYTHVCESLCQYFKYRSLSPFDICFSYGNYGSCLRSNLFEGRSASVSLEKLKDKDLQPTKTFSLKNQ